MNCAANALQTENVRRFCAWFGMEPPNCQLLWNCIENNGLHEENDAMQPKHLLWVLFFLKCYGKEDDNASRVGCCHMTFCNKVWIILAAIE